MFQPRIWLLILMICVPAALRIVDHPWNVAPMGALALFAGACFRHKAWAFIVPLAAMLLSDIGIGLTRGNSAFYTFHSTTTLVYLSYALSVGLGMAVRGYWKRSDAGSRRDKFRLGAWLGTRVLPLASATLAGALVFFFVTNFGVWALMPTYPKTWEGLVHCYTAGLPFFRNTLGGDVFYVVVLFGGFGLLRDKVGVFQESDLLVTE